MAYRARTSRINTETYTSLAHAAVVAAPTGYVEWHTADITLLHKLHVRTTFNDLAGNLMTQNKSERSSRAPADHVLRKSK